MLEKCTSPLDEDRIEILDKIKEVYAKIDEEEQKKALAGFYERYAAGVQDEEISQFYQTLSR